MRSDSLTLSENKTYFVGIINRINSEFEQNIVGGTER